MGNKVQLASASWLCGVNGNVVRFQYRTVQLRANASSFTSQPDILRPIIDEVYNLCDAGEMGI